MRAHEAAPVSGITGRSRIEGDAAILALPKLAAEINHAHATAIEHAQSAVQRARHAGELLLEAKQQVEHGQWLPWLKSNCPTISERTAQSYMRLARHCLTNSSATQIESLTLRQALEELAEPKESKSAAVADLSAKVTAGNVTIGAIEHPHHGSQLVFILQESRKHPGYWHIINFREGDCTARPVAAAGIKTALRFYPAASLCTWSRHPDCDVSLCGEGRP